MEVENDVRRLETPLPGVLVLEPKVHGDERGFFLETYNRKTLNEAGVTCPFVQDNLSRSARGVLRGLHYQIRRAQAKLVRVLRGSVFDVAVDLRRGSPTFGRWHGEVLTAESHRMVFIPEGFAHGFYVLSESADFFYKCSDSYSPQDERGIAWDDPRVGIDWPVQGAPPTLSARDRAWKTLDLTAREDLPA